MNKQKLDIKSLTSELKSRSRVGDRKTDMSKPDGSIHSDRSLSGQSAEKQFLKLLKEVNSRDHYQMDRFIYVDADIHEVFNKLKTQTKLKLSYLASHLLEQFIIEHKDSIKSILSKSQNKFLD